MSLFSKEREVYMTQINKNRINAIEKIMVSARIPYYVKQYADERKLTIAQLIMKGFDSYRSNDKKHALERLKYHEDRMLHWKKIVLQHEQENNTKNQLCNIIKKQFLEQGRGGSDTKRQDMSWLESKAEQLCKNGVIVSAQELYDYCVREGDNEK